MREGVSAAASFNYLHSFINRLVNFPCMESPSTRQIIRILWERTKHFTKNFLLPFYFFYSPLSLSLSQKSDLSTSRTTSRSSAQVKAIIQVEAEKNDCESGKNYNDLKSKLCKLQETALLVLPFKKNSDPESTLVLIFISVWSHFGHVGQCDKWI